MKVLVVDDEKLARLNIIKQFDERFSVIEAVSYEDALRKIQNHEFEICYIDLKLDQSNELKGMKLIPTAVDKGIYTVVMTSIDDEEIAEMAYDLGCRDVYNKGNEEGNIAETLNRYFLSKDSFTEELLFKEVIATENKKYKENLKRLLKIIPTEIPVTILGESGTGKSHLAKTIHKLSKRKGKFIELNCSTFNGDTLKSELFGHTRGSFTGALSDKMGKLQEAHQGTLFLDEIGSMSLEMQESLLKAIEEKAFYPVGSNKIIYSDFRVVCATLDDLEFLIKSGKFRFDLFQRISGYTFTQPPLRQRSEDIIPILKQKLSTSRRVIFKDSVKKILKEYTWPGNIRELLRFADVISLESTGIVKVEDVLAFTKESKLERQTKLLHENHYQLIKDIGLKAFLEKLTQEIVLKSLEENNGKARQAIKELGVSSATFYRYIDKEETSPVILGNPVEKFDELH